MKSLGLSSREKNASKTLQNKDDTIKFKVWENAKFSQKFFSELTNNLVTPNEPVVPNKFCNIITKNYFPDIFNIKKFEFHYSMYANMLLKRIQSCLNTSKAAATDQIPTKFWKEAADVLAYL